LDNYSIKNPRVFRPGSVKLVAYQSVNPAGERLINEGVLNSVIVLMLVTAIMGPIITARVARSLQVVPSTEWKTDSLSVWWESQEQIETADNRLQQDYPPFIVVVPIYNPLTQRYLLEMAALIARHESGQIMPLAITKAHLNMDDPQLVTALAQSQERLRLASEISQEFNVQASPTIRIDDNVALGISHASREHNASLVIMGWGNTRNFRARLFGSLIDKVFWSSHCPVAVTRLLKSPTEIRRILVPVGDLMRVTIGTIRFAQILADANQAEVVLLHVNDAYRSPSQRLIPDEQVTHFTSQLSDIANQGNLQVNTNILTIVGDDIAKVIIEQAQAFDLVVLRSVRYRTAGGLAVSEVTTQVINNLKCSIVMLGEPQ
ncbi:universal stress protein, partial [Aphanizomenon sp. PH219]|nr:universal stress protein [Aphanizomenon sp. PH219]